MMGGNRSLQRQNGNRRHTKAKRGGPGEETVPCWETKTIDQGQVWVFGAMRVYQSCSRKGIAP